MSDFRVPIVTVLAAFGVPATITRPFPDDAPISAAVAWLSPRDDFAGTSEFQRREGRRILALSRDAVPTVPRGTFIEAPELEGGPPQRWRVDGVESVMPDEVRVVVVADPEGP